MSYKTFREAIAFAVSRESEEAGFYELFAGKAEKPATKAMFEALAAEEHKHQAMLEELKPERLSGTLDKRIDVSEPRSSAARFDPAMDFVAVLRMGIQREEESIALYQNMSREAAEPTLKKLFSALVEQERGHRAKLQDELDSVVMKDY